MSEQSHLSKYVENTRRTRGKLSTNWSDNMHMLMGMITEVGELVDVYKKHLAYGKGIDLINVQEELGDLMFYIGGFCDINGFDLDKILDVNTLKLNARYPDKFDKDKANNRDLDKERKILDELGY
jgi:NTP pyrophosphatase (non-canonical NTP hydrolase)